MGAEFVFGLLILFLYLFYFIFLFFYFIFHFFCLLVSPIMPERLCHVR